MHCSALNARMETSAVDVSPDVHDDQVIAVMHAKLKPMVTCTAEVQLAVITHPAKAELLTSPAVCLLCKQSCS